MITGALASGLGRSAARRCGYERAAYLIVAAYASDREKYGAIDPAAYGRGYRYECIAVGQGTKRAKRPRRPKQKRKP